MKKHSDGFTLVELLVVISIIALLVAIVLPALNNALFRGRLTATAANGRSIQQAIFAKQTESVYTSTVDVYPQSTGTSAYTDSSSYLAALTTNGTLNVGLNFFTAPGIPVAPTIADFKGGSVVYNAWCVTADLSDASPETVPFLFTRNLDVSALDSTVYGSPTADDKPGKLGTTATKTKPFDDKGFVFVTKGGAAYALFKDDLKVGTTSAPGPFRNLFNIIDPNTGTEIGNTVLRPAGD